MFNCLPQVHLHKSQNKKQTDDPTSDDYTSLTIELPYINNEQNIHQYKNPYQGERTILQLSTTNSNINNSTLYILRALLSCKSSFVSM